jgi:hypothetical protein
LKFDETPTNDSDSTPELPPLRGLKSKLLGEIKNDSNQETSIYSNAVQLTYEEPYVPEFCIANQDQRKRPLLRISRA